jgi:predicted amidohydrolase YtcJ
VALAGSSDAPVVEPDVIAGIRAAVQRKTAAGVVLGPGQGLTAGEALVLFTTDAATALGLGHERGSIATGLAADFVVLNQNPLDADVNWDDFGVDMTILRGEVAYGRSIGTR